MHVKLFGERLISPVGSTRSCPPVASEENEAVRAKRKWDGPTVANGVRLPLSLTRFAGVCTCVTIGLFTMLYTIRSCRGHWID